MNSQLGSILSLYQVTDPADQNLVRVAAEAATTRNPEADILRRSELSHQRDKAVGAAIVAAVRAGQGRGRLLAFAILGTALPLVIIAAWIVTAQNTRLSEEEAKYDTLEKSTATLESHFDRNSEDFKAAAAQAAAAALNAQKSVTDNAQNLASNFAKITAAQGDEITALKGENQNLRDQLAQIRAASAVGK